MEDIITEVYKNKKCWASHIAELPDNRWTTKISTRNEKKRKKGRPSTRWEDPLIATYGNIWTGWLKIVNLGRKTVTWTYGRTPRNQ